NATSDEADITRQLSDLLPAKEKTSAPGGGLHGVVAQGRMSCLLAGSLRGGELLTLLHTARLNGPELYSWLRDVPEKLPSWPASRLDELQPYRRQAN
ncbi:hypothetical protein APU34_23590, partial [Escherichia coli]|uniref:transposase domain-containing protein n=2 Tax=Escherichia coli TaxID=562 RepID=UPI000BC6A638